MAESIRDLLSYLYSETQAESIVARLDATPEQLALAEAQARQAQAALDLARAVAQDALLIAPFDGTIASINVDVGEVIAPGTPTITFGNLSNMRVETTDLAESEVAKIIVGQNVAIKLDALPDNSFTGRVLRIAPIANDNRGDRVFQVVIEVPEIARSELRWGMTANVEITTGN